MGFILAKGVERPRKSPTRWVTIDRPNYINYSIKRVANNLFKIKHWSIVHGSYDEIENEQATWFIDPPYQHGGHAYPCSSKKIDFKYLGNWCRSRKGQTIVCESTKANWMDFKPLMSHYGRTGKQKEAIWSNLPTAFDHEQLDLFS